MNLRIAPEHIRFRISEDEFATLLAQGALVNSTMFDGIARLDYAIRTQPDTATQDGQTLELSTHRRADTTTFELRVFTNGIDQLQSGNAGKDGIQEHLAFDNGDMLTIGLEIDLHSKKGAGKS